MASNLLNFSVFPLLVSTSNRNYKNTQRRLIIHRHHEYPSHSPSSNFSLLSFGRNLHLNSKLTPHTQTSLEEESSCLVLLQITDCDDTSALRVKEILAADERVHSVGFDSSTKTAAVSLTKPSTSGGSEELLRRLSEGGFEAKVICGEKMMEAVDDDDDDEGLGEMMGEKKWKKETIKVAKRGDHDGLLLNRKMHDFGLKITEPEAHEEFTGEREAYLAAVLASYRRIMLERTKFNLGYHLNLDVDVGPLSGLQSLSINNFGDPFIEGNYGVHSRRFEVGVLDWFARLWKIEKDQYWGYVTNGGTEGNLHGILVGRELFPDGIFYTSKESHYSVFKVARMYRMDCVEVETLKSGEIDCVDFKHKLLKNKDKPAIINVNIGTTFKGAIDDLDLMIQTLEQCGFSRNRFYIHCDAALFGLMLPFVKRAPEVTFMKPIGSICVSGHKFLGSTMPCGVEMTRKDHINTLTKNIEYMATSDATISGSRNGHNPIFLWYVLNKKGYSGLQKEVQRCLYNAHYLKEQLKEAKISVMLNKLSNIVVFERPQNEELIRRWQLSCQGNIAHVVVMPNVSIEKLDAFLRELVEKRSIWLKADENHQLPCVALDIGKENCVCPLHK